MIFYVNVMAADGQARNIARSSVIMVLSYFFLDESIIYPVGANISAY